MYAGGIFGRGLGASREKFGLLPAPHTDSIFAIIGEELGLLGAVLVIVLFALLMARGFRIALGSPDKLTQLLAAGITFYIGIQALINMSVLLGLLPFAGNALPFFSYGGSNLTSTLAAIGILLNISRRKPLEVGPTDYAATVGIGWRNRRRRVSRLSHSRRPARTRSRCSGWAEKAGWRPRWCNVKGSPSRRCRPPASMAIGPRQLPGNLLRLARGVPAARRILRRFRPDVLLFTGGYVGVPVAMAAGRRPRVTYVPDLEPGLALKFVSRGAAAVCVTAEQAREFYPAHQRVVVTGYPTRPGLQAVDRQQARIAAGAGGRGTGAARLWRQPRGAFDQRGAVVVPGRRPGHDAGGARHR